MKILAAILNVAVLVTIGGMVIANGLPDLHDLDGLAFFALFSVTPLATLLALLRRPRERKGYVALWLERRRLEELARIRDLREHAER